MPLPALSAEQLIKPQGFELRMSLIFAGIFMPLGVHLPYLPLWLAENGFNAKEIAVILAAPMFVRVATTPIITALADKARDRATVLKLMALAAALSSCGYFLAPSYGIVLLTSIALTVAMAAQAPLADSIALSGIRRFGSVYATMRIWGSISFLVANLAGGVILTITGTSGLPVMITAGLLSVVAFSFFTPKLGRPRRASPLSAAEMTDLRTAVVNPVFLLLVAGAGLIVASHAFLYGFASIYWSAIGLGNSVVGLLWAASVMAEVAMFLLFGRLFSNLGSSTVVTIAGVGAIIRWLLFPLVRPSGMGVPGFIFVQALHAFSTGMILIGIQKIIADAVPEERTGAAQGVAYFANGFAMATATLLSGPLYASLGVDGFYSMAGIAAAGVALVALAARYHHDAGIGDPDDPAQVGAGGHDARGIQPPGT